MDGETGVKLEVDFEVWRQ